MSITSPARQRLRCMSITSQVCLPLTVAARTTALSSSEYVVSHSTSSMVTRALPFRDTAQSILKDLGGDLHGTYLASAGATLLGQTCKPLSGGVAHRHLGMPHPARIGWPAWTETLPRLKAGLYGCDDMGQPCGTERAAAGVRHLTHDLAPRPAAILSMFFAIFIYLRFLPFGC